MMDRDRDDARAELYELTRALRLRLAWLARGGCYSVPGQRSAPVPLAGPVPVPVPVPDAAEPVLSPELSRDRTPAMEPAVAPGAEARPSQASQTPRRPAPANVPPGLMSDDGLLPSEQLARALGELGGADTKTAAPGRVGTAGASGRGGRERAGHSAAQERDARSPSTSISTAAAAVRASDTSPRRGLEVVRADLGDCRRCKLSQTRQNIVFGEGAADAPLMFVGEAPGETEDTTGRPFVGKAGELLDKMIEAMGWTRQTVYIANIVKCRPPRNRDPEPDEIDACRPFLARQIDVIAPRILVTLGRPAAHLLLDTTAPISALRGRFQTYQGIKVMPTFHPAYLLRYEERKREAWSDLKQVIAELERLGIRPPKPPRA